LTPGAKVKVSSIYELIGVEVEVTIDGEKTTLESPWTTDGGSMSQYLPEILDALTINTNSLVDGRININEARMEVLMGIPGMTEQLASSIVSSRSIGANGEAPASIPPSHLTAGWLMIEGLVDQETMKTLDKYLTARGDVFRAQVLGYFESGGPIARVEAVIDATELPARVIFMRDLSELGAGYPKPALAAAETGR
jgi:hypothetical protein